MPVLVKTVLKHALVITLGHIQNARINPYIIPRGRNQVNSQKKSKTNYWFSAIFIRHNHDGLQGFSPVEMCRQPAILPPSVNYLLLTPHWISLGAL